MNQMELNSNLFKKWIFIRDIHFSKIAADTVAKQCQLKYKVYVNENFDTFTNLSMQCSSNKMQ